MKIFVKVLGLALVLALLVPVIGTAQDKEKNEGSTLADTKALAGAAKVTLAAALDKALKAAPGIALVGELEQEENTLIFTFDILPKLTSDEITEIHVDAKTGAVIKSEEEGEEGEEAEGKEAEGAEEPSIADMQSMAKTAKVTMAAALQTALKAAPGTAIVAELENEGGKLIFSFDILPGPAATELKEVHIDAKTGLVIKAVEETEKEEAEEKEAEGAEGAEEASIKEMQSMAKTAKVTMAAALQTALKAAPGTVLTAELENENGQLIFSFDILPTPSATELKEVHVDAKTGAVIKTEIEK